MPLRVSPAKRDGFSTSSSPLVEHTRRVAIEAQAFRTHVRLQDLGAAGRDELMARDDQEEMLPDGASELRILRSFAQESPVYPGTEARRNVTVRRSRDRLSVNSTGEARTPEAVASRRPSIRARDRRYSLDNDQNLASQSRTERQHPKSHEEDSRGEYLLES